MEDFGAAFSWAALRGVANLREHSGAAVRDGQNFLAVYDAGAIFILAHRRRPRRA